MIEFRTLGTLDLRDPGNGREFGAMLARPKRVALLAYLALAKPRGVHHRDTLLGIFWPETSQERARHALNQALYVLRRALGGGVVVTRGAEEIGINVAELWCDAAAFDAAVEAGKLVEALELYGGDLLNGFYLSDCPEFEQWRDGERARLRERASEAAWSLADGAEEAGNAVAAAHWGRRATAFATGDEGALRRLIVLLDRVGDRTGALREYEAFAEQVRQDYEADPAPETTALIASVRAREQANGGVPPSAPLTKQAADAPVTRVTVEARRFWRTRRLAAAALVVLGAVTVAGATLIRNSRAALALDPTRVLVDIFQNETGDPSLGHLGRMATDRVTAGLTLTRFVDVVSLGTRLLSREPVVPDTGLLEQADLQVLARANGTGTVVSGSYYLQGDSVHFLAHVTDAGTGEELATLEPVVGAIDAPVAAVEQLRDRVMTTLATLTDPRLAKWMRDASQPPTFEAYTEFMEGIELYSHQKHWEALPHFLAAAALDSTFTMPLLWAISTGHAGGDSLLQVLDQRRERLAPLDRHLLDYHLGRWRGEPTSSLRAIRRVVEIAPGSEYLYEAGHAALAANHPREAIEFLTQANPTAGWLRGLHHYWRYLTQAYHLLGEHQHELEAARRARQQYPDHAMVRGYEISALVALGRMDEVTARIEEVQQLEEASRSLWDAAWELRAHGYRAAGMRTQERHIEWLESRPSEEKQRGSLRLELGTSLMLVGRLDEARVLYEEWFDRRPDDDLYKLTMFAQLAAREGRREEVLRISRVVDSIPRPLGGSAMLNNTWDRSTIAVALGDRERAMALLRQRIARDYAIWLHRAFQLEPLWDYRPFQELLRPKG